MHISPLLCESVTDFNPKSNASDEAAYGSEKVTNGEDNENSCDEAGDGRDEAGDDDRDVEVENSTSQIKTKRKRHETEDEEDKRESKTTRNKDEEDDIVERFEFEIEDSVANWFDDFRINRNIVPESSDEEEDPIVVRDRKIRIGTNDKLAIGRTFLSGFEFKEVVLHHALRTRENIKQNRWGKDKMSFVCGQDKSCDWKVYAAFDKTRQLWVVRTTCGYHRCKSNGKCKLLKSPVIGRLFLDKLRLQPNYMPLDIQRHIKEQWNILSSIGQVQRGRLLALKWLQEEYAQHFAHLRGYATELINSNAGSTTVVDTYPNADGEDVFNRFYVCLGAMKQAFYYCRPIIGIDGTFLKHAVKGCLLTAIAHDANNQIYPIAWAAVQTENADNWLWFLKLLKVDLNLKDGQKYVIISDRSKGIISSVKNELPNIEHRMCVKHIVDNLKTRHGDKDLLKKLVWNLAWSYNHAEFEANLNKIRAYDRSLYDDVMKENPRSWSRAYYRIGSSCEDVDNNATESFNATIVKKKLSEYATEILEEEKEDAMRCEITKGTHGRFDVYLDGNSHSVNLSTGKWQCSCCKWQITGIPCEHAYAAVLDVNKDIDDFVSPYFTTLVWKEVYDKGPDPVCKQVKKQDTRVTISQVLDQPRYVSVSLTAH
ncbi:uncharacterized protein LOC111831414 [Capsella rubella]|uniref:uncharacterized protein LOC111831414 n=1 Tax=Capsella rubella TaxID=81985 RepID=UPI000CD5337A|nr:uncharacterized protein LOC111831414 [Capsella rubella]